MHGIATAEPVELDAWSAAAPKKDGDVVAGTWGVENGALG